MTNKKVPATNPERERKPVAKLTHRDWLAASNEIGGEHLIAEVVDVHLYASVHEDDSALLVYRQIGETIPQSEHMRADGAVELATEAEIAEAQSTARRIKTADQLRKLADLIMRHEVPMPRYSLQITFGEVPYEEAEALAERIGGDLGNAYAGRDEITWPKGHQAYQDGVHATWWTRTPEPDPTPADETGLSYTRADTDEDDPTPVSPARVPMHVGGMVGPVDGGVLVDFETRSDGAA